MCLWIILVLLPIWQILVNYISIDFELSAEGIIEELALIAQFILFISYLLIILH